MKDTRTATTARRAFSARSLIVSAVGLGLLAGLGSTVAAAPQRIHLPHGPRPAYVHGHLRGFQSRAVFLLHARRGQTLDMLTTKAGGPTVVTATFPNGREDGAPGGDQVVLPQTGDYRITVTEHRMGEPWNGPFTIRIRLR